MKRKNIFLFRYNQFLY